MKHSRYSYNRTSTNPPKSNIGSLKAIMNQGRIPLSQYINEKSNKSPNPVLGYMDKFKAMMGGDCKSHRPSQQAMDIEKQLTQGEKLNKYLGAYQPLDFLNQQKSQNQSGKSRSKSSVARPRPMSRSKGQEDKNQTKIVQDRVLTKITHIRTQSEIKQEDALQANFILPKSTKSLKQEIVNYSKFKLLLGGGEQGNIFELGEILGSGANATVRLGRNRKSNILYAIKIYEKYKLVQPVRLKRVMREMEILSGLNHPNIIGIGSCFEDKRQIHILFEHIDKAQTLHQFVRAHNFQVSDKLKQIITQGVVSAVAYLHGQGISHRDIKTDNLMVNPQGKVKLIDFGFATRSNKAEIHCGTPNYMAPELFGKRNSYNPMKADLWALGVLLYYLHEGSYPFKGYSEKDLAKNITQGFFSFQKTPEPSRNIIKALLSFDPNHRPDPSILAL